jgi:hypothetical protein
VTQGKVASFDVADGVGVGMRGLGDRSAFSHMFATRACRADDLFAKRRSEGRKIARGDGGQPRLEFCNAVELPPVLQLLRCSAVAKSHLPGGLPGSR